MNTNTTMKNTNSRVTTNKTWRTTCEEGDHQRVKQVLEEDQDHNLEYHKHECEKEHQQNKGVKKWKGDHEEEEEWKRNEEHQIVTPNP